MSDQDQTPINGAGSASDYQVVLMLGRLESEVRGVRALLENYNARMDRQESAHGDLAKKQSEDARALWEAHAKAKQELTDKIHATDKKQTWFAAAAAVGVGFLVWMIDHLPFLSNLSNKVN